MFKRILPSDLEDLPITYRQEIPGDYRDAFGHMNVMWYTHLFGCAFEKFGDQFGFNEAYFRANRAGSFALETHVRYLSEVLIGSHVTLRARALGCSAKRFHYIQFMTVDETGALAATHEQVSAHIDMRTRRMAPMPDDMLARFDELIARQNQLGWQAPTCGAMKP